MNLEQVENFVRSELLEYGLKKALTEKPVQITDTFIKPMLVFLSSQNNSVPIGALLGHLIGARQDRIEEGIAFIEACVDYDLIDIEEVNENWVVLPLRIDHEIDIELGVDVRPIPKHNRDAFCGKIIHKPIASRVDHLDYLNKIKFEVNSEFLKLYPQVPKNAPYKHTLPGILRTANGTVYLDHNYDTRGRTYCSSHLNYQGTEYEKCLVKFKKELKITEEGYNNITEYINNLKPEEEYLRYCAELALNSEYTGIPLGTDARASGTQILAVLTGCEISAENVGLLDKNNDPYQIAADAANFDIPSHINPRELFKPACMQHFYGGVKTPKELLGEDNYEKFQDTLWEYFPGCSQGKEDIQSLYHNTPVFKWEMPDGFLVQQAVIHTERIELSFKNDPEVIFGFAYKHLKGKDKGLELPANLVHSVDGYIARELIYRASKGGEFTNELTLRRAIKKAGSHDNPNEVFCLHKLLHTDVDKWALLGKSFLERALNYLNTVKGMPEFEVISIHDDFKSHPNFLNWVKLLYVEILADIAEGNLFNDLFRQINLRTNISYEPTPTLAAAMRTAYKNGTGGGLF